MTTMCARLVILLAALFLGGCSTVRLAYNQADFISAWMADDYFDLTPEQKQVFKAHFERFHGWHRTTQLPDYASLLESVQQRVGAGATAADADWLTEAIHARLKTMVRQSYREAALMLAQLSDEQIAAARRQFDQNNRKFARENGVGASPDEQRRLRAKRMIERIEHWTGPLDAAQENRVREMSRALPLITEQRYQERLRRQAEFLALLKERRNTDSFAPRLRDWLLDWERTRTPAYHAEYSQFMQASSRLYVAVLHMITPEQKHHVASVIQRYQQAFRDLSTQVARQQPAAQP